MLERGQISGPQAMFLVIAVVLPTAILFLPAFAAEAARRDAWLVPWAALLQGVAALGLVWSLSKSFPGLTPIQYARATLGEVAGKIVGLFLILYVFIPAAVILREFAEFITIAFMPTTPLLVFMGLVGLLSVYCVRSGLEVVARVTTLIVPLILISFGVILLLLLNMVNLQYLRPVLETPPRPWYAEPCPPPPGWARSPLRPIFFPSSTRRERVLRPGWRVC